MRKIFFRVLFVFILLIILIYVTNITAIPDSIVLFKGESLDLGVIIGINLVDKENNKAIETSSIIKNNDKVEKKTVTVSLFNIIKLKDIEVDTIPNAYVIPLGNSVGLKLYTSGVLVVGMTEIEGKKPYEGAGIEEGDMIVEMDEKEISCTSDLLKIVNNSEGENIDIKYIRNGKEYVTTMAPIKTKKDEYKLGLWVRDGAAGIGTMTYYEPQTNKFAALGHGILDIDTEELINISSGELVTSRISSIIKGEEGIPGEIKGSIVGGETIGNVNQNTNFGIYGELTNKLKISSSKNNEMKVANREDIKIGNAKVLLDLENGVRKEYDIEITKIYRNNNVNNKSMQIKVTDDRLLELTGGIIQRYVRCTNYSKW